MNRRIIQIIPAPTLPSGDPVFRYARRHHDSPNCVGTYGVIAWALVKYAESDEEWVEPVFIEGRGPTVADQGEDRGHVLTPGETLQITGESVEGRTVAKIETEGGWEEWSNAGPCST